MRVVVVGQWRKMGEFLAHGVALGYLREPLDAVEPANWPCAYDPAVAAPMRAALERILLACLDLARSSAHDTLDPLLAAD